MFNPVPNVDSCVINIDIVRDKFKIKDILLYQKFIMGCFQMKRKTLYNNLVKLGINKENVLKAYGQFKIDSNVRPENLTAEQYVNLFNFLY